MKVRILDAGDGAKYRELRLQALHCNPESFLTTYEDYVNRPLEQVSGQLGPTDDVLTLGSITSDGRLVGTATLVRERPLKMRHIASVQAMFVAYEFRRLGIGRKLLAELICRAKEMKGIELLKLSVVKDNLPAVELYKSLGFQPYGLEPKALKVNGRYWDEWHMMLDFSSKQS